jgi:hypothetical protein
MEDIKIDFSSDPELVIRNDDSEWASRRKNPVKFGCKN